MPGSKVMRTDQLGKREGGTGSLETKRGLNVDETQQTCNWGRERERAGKKS